ncbi:helix-turn-helix transcriptional regulator [Enterococcus rotai]|uniref:helix-turn-helix transcriptional regulator n=1 Tax=Enterococcus rotai TaxID=118060 RepID=UPI0032B5BB23
MVANRKKFNWIQRFFKIYPYPNNLEEYRLAADMTQKELGKKVEELAKEKFSDFSIAPTYLSPQTINAIETYRYYPDLGIMILVAEVLNEERETIFDLNAEIE